MLKCVNDSMSLFAFNKLNIIILQVLIKKSSGKVLQNI